MNSSSQLTPRQQFWFLAVVGFLFAGSVGFAGFMAYKQNAEHAKMQALFQPHLIDFTSIPRTKEEECHLGMPRGKMALVDYDKLVLDEMHFFTPGTASTPDETETIVWLMWDSVAEAEYSGGGYAYRWLCTVSVFDREDRRLVALKKFRGDDPPMMTTTPAGSDDYGPKPDGEIRSYLKALRGQ
jgi:hypothetical protein